jgi:plastocyanin
MLAIKDFKFLPEAITVAAGTTVRWTNRDAAPHTATADDGSFDTGNLRAGATGEVTLSKPGVYAYSCEFHSFMRAKITVR